MVLDILIPYKCEKTLLRIVTRNYNCLLRIIIIIYSFRYFHISISWWFFTGVCSTANLLKSPGLFPVFWPFSAMLSLVSTRPPTSKSSRPFNKPFNDAKSINHNWYKSHFHVPQFFQFSCKVKVLIILFTFLQIYSVVRRDSKVDNCACYLFFLLIIIRSGLLAGITWSVCMLKSNRVLSVSFSRTGAELCIYHVFVWSNLNSLHISQWITLPTQSYLASYSCVNLLHSLFMWSMVSSLSPHSLHLLFCCVLSTLALIWLVLMALSCAAIRRDSVSFLRFPFLTQVQVFWCEMLFISRLKSP